ncbi:putative pectinesterase 10 [Medicago truncatula]|uniref:putative pectinesterase 10 n=1 Tax=Medicago truncatula TaxID=3880 RepID=UPI000D2F2AB2|nr:putative pectinesterase 10 [Medicago truncatula]
MESDHRKYYTIDCGGNQVANTIIVDQQGKGAFQTIQAAIDSIKSQNNQWIMININPGIYKEKVLIPDRKSCIILKGSGSNNTIITYDDSSHKVGTSMSATFHSSPPNVILNGITFKNTYGSDGPAVAASIYGDKSAIFECSFIGYQDTLLSSKGRQYFKNCYIQGEDDFIFGEGQSYFENCVMNATQAESKPSGFVTSQRRESPNDPNGFVFRGGYVVGNGTVSLGRPWGPYSRVIFWGTYFTSVVTPQGWDAPGLDEGQEQNLTYAEVNCTGPGANIEKRVKWEKKPDSLNLNEYTLSSFINNDGWLANVPSILL